MIAEESLENLKPFEKGESGNPSGRPKGSLNRSTIAKKWLSVLSKAKNPLTGEMQDLSQEEIITLAQIAKAYKGDVNAYKALMDSGYGAPKQEIDQSNAGEMIIKVVREGNPDQAKDPSSSTEADSV